MRSVYRRHDARLGSERSSDQNIKSSGSEAQREHSRYRRSRIERLGSLRSVWRASICSSHHGQRFRAPVLLAPQQGACGQAQASGAHHPRRVTADRLTGPRRQLSRPPPSFQPGWWPVCLPGSSLNRDSRGALGSGTDGAACSSSWTRSGGSVPESRRTPCRSRRASWADHQ
jgi:hypothetical protein